MDFTYNRQDRVGRDRLMDISVLPHQRYSPPSIEDQRRRFENRYKNTFKEMYLNKEFDYHISTTTSFEFRDVESEIVGYFNDVIYTWDVLNKPDSFSFTKNGITKEVKVILSENELTVEVTVKGAGEEKTNKISYKGNLYLFVLPFTNSVYSHNLSSMFNLDPDLLSDLRYMVSANSFGISCLGQPTWSDFKRVLERCFKI